MGERNIPVPAESLRTIAESASAEARRARQNGRRNTALHVERSIGTAFASLDAKDGEFVSVPASTVSTLASHIDFGDSSARRHSDAAEVFLKQYGVWSSREE